MGQLIRLIVIFPQRLETLKFASLAKKKTWLEHKFYLLIFVKKKRKLNK